MISLLNASPFGNSWEISLHGPIIFDARKNQVEDVLITLSLVGVPNG